MSNVRKPKLLSKGDAIYLVAPSFGCASEPYFSRLEEAIRRLTKEGYRIKTGPNVYLNEGVAASAPGEERAKEFLEAYLDEDSSLVCSVGGGELMNEMIPYVDFESIRKAPPKFFMGFSDNTSLAFLLPTLCNVQAIYGPNAPAFYDYPFRFANKDALALLTGETKIQGYPKYYGKSNKNWPALYKPRANMEKKIVPFQYDGPKEGILLGGCLDVLLTIIGTRHDKVKEFVAEQESIIWFFEACDLSPLSIRRGLLQLKEAGWLSKTSMVLLGRHLCGIWNTQDFMGVNKYNAATDILGDLNVPLLMDIDLGHLGPSMPFIEGAKARIEYKDNNIFVEYLQ